MNEFEKAEMLRERANVSFEEARDALKACGGDLLDAMVFLEKMGRARKSTGSAESGTAAATAYSYPAVRTSPSFGSRLWNLVKTFFRKSVENDLVISHNGVEKFRMPALVLVIALFMFSVVTIVAMGVSLLFGVSYRFMGKDDLTKVNNALGTIGNEASRWWENRHVSYEVNELCKKYDGMDKK